MAFFGCGFRELAIPASVRKLESYAFMNCKQLREVVFEPDSRLERIGTGCFNKSSFMESVASGVQSGEPELLRIAQQSGRLNSDSIAQLSCPGDKAIRDRHNPEGSQ